MAGHIISYLIETVDIFPVLHGLVLVVGVKLFLAVMVTGGVFLFSLVMVTGVGL